jgi:hypothetical protein
MLGHYRLGLDVVPVLRPIVEIDRELSKADPIPMVDLFAELRKLGVEFPRMLSDRSCPVPTVCYGFFGEMPEIAVAGFWTEVVFCLETLADQ